MHRLTPKPFYPLKAKKPPPIKTYICKVKIIFQYQNKYQTNFISESGGESVPSTTERVVTTVSGLKFFDLSKNTR